MKKSKEIIFYVSLLVFSLIMSRVTSAQDQSLGQQVDAVTYKWDAEAIELETYEGLLEFCNNKEYRTAKIDLLNEIHHLDSVLYDRAVKASRVSNDKNIHKLITEIESLETEYGMKSMIRFMKDECSAQKDLEKNKDGLATEFGSESYGGQAYVLELELQKFVTQTTKRIDHVRKHVHKLNIK